MLSHFSCIQLYVTLWTVARQAPLSKGFSRQQYWSGLPCPPPGALPNLGIEPETSLSPALAGGFFATSATYFFFNPIFFISELYSHFWLLIFGVEVWYSGCCDMSPSSFFRTKTLVLPGVGDVGCWWVTAESFCICCLQPMELLPQSHTLS